MKKLFDFLVERRYWVLSFFIILAIGNIFLLQYVKINYDISSYLAEKSNTRISLEIMNSEFESSGSLQIMVEDVNVDRALEIKELIETTEGVKIVLFDETSDASYHDGYARYNIFLKQSDFDKATRVTVNELKEKLKDEKIYLTGGAVESLYLGDAVNEDMYMILLTALIVVFIILVINSVSWIEPVVFMIVIGVAIIINLGSNALLPNISFVTGSICAVMQLALAMDYSIMLLHRYISEREENPSLDNKEVVKIALKKSIMPILSSGLTTIAGLLALVFMTFKIGFDIGIVLSKGIVISLIVVIFFMPGLLLVFSNLINKTRHRNLYQIIREKFPNMPKRRAHYQYKSRFIAFGVLVVLIVVGFLFYLKTDYIYTLEASNDQNAIISKDKKKIEEVFGTLNNVVILLPKNTEDKEKEVCEYLENYNYQGKNPFSSIQGSYASGLKQKYTAEELSLSYNLPLSIVEEIYDGIGSKDGKYNLYEVIDYATKTSFITNYINNTQNEMNMLSDISLILDEDIDAVTLSRVLSNYSGIDFSVENANALILKVGNDLSFKEFIIKINEEEFLNELYSGFVDYVKACDDLNTVISKNDFLLVFNYPDIFEIFEDSESVLFSNAIMKMDRTKLNDEEKEVYDYYLMVLETKDEMHTIEEIKVMEDFSYNILPSVIYLPSFLFKDQVSNQDIQRSVVELLKNRIEDLSTKLSSSIGLLDLVNQEMSDEEVSTIFNLPVELISPIYVSLGKDKITGSELLQFIKDNNYIKEVGETFIVKFNEASRTVNYAHSMFESENYSRIILNLTYKRSSDEAIQIARNLQTELRGYYSEYYIAAECGAFADFEDSFASDSIKISIASLCFILIIIAISFRSFAVPIILTLIIQGAIWVTMAISVWAHSEVYFICYLMIVCIQMGTTIDYGILYTSKYLEERRNNDPETSITNASGKSITTILTSGAIIVVASFLVGMISKVSIISSIGYLLSIGTMVSLAFILFALPQVLVVCEGFIEITTYKCQIKK